MIRPHPFRSGEIRKHKPKPRPGRDPKMLEACRGQDCWLAIPGVCCGDIATVVPCHANWSDYGKSMGRKADDEFSVPGCRSCHSELDQGRLFTKEEKRGLWEAAFERWQPYRDGAAG